MAMTFGSFVEASANKFPNRTALIYEDRVVTYHELNERANRLANALLKRGVRKGDKVSLYLENCVEYFETIFAVSKIGAVWIPIGFRLTAQEMKYIVENSDSVALIFSDVLLGNVEEARKGLRKVSPDLIIMVGGKVPRNVVDYNELLAGGEPQNPAILVNEEDDFYIAYTAGTTGAPKGALFDHRARMTSILLLSIEYGLHGADRHLCAGPLYHAAPWVFSFVHLFLGAQVVLMRHFEPVGTLQLMQKYRITTSFMVPTMYNMILNLPAEQRDAFDLSSVRVLISAASPLATQTKEGIIKLFKQAGLHEFYGSTEIGVVSNLRPEDQLRKVRSVGPAMYLGEFRIFDENGQEVPQGKEGVIYMTGPTLLKEYYKNPDATRKAYRGRWFSNLDIGRLDEDGYLYIMDRKADMIISGGVNIYPAEIEDLLIKHPKVLEAAVIGIPDEKWGESILASIVPKDGMNVTIEEITAFCDGKIAKYKTPRFVQNVRELPKSPAGKVLKRILREPFWKDSEARV
jgi:fatty-acyl-CoA synthase/long-chain acyl-CoA synthetase